MSIYDYYHSVLISSLETDNLCFEISNKYFGLIAFVLVCIILLLVSLMSFTCVFFIIILLLKPLSKTVRAYIIKCDLFYLCKVPGKLVFLKNHPNFLNFSGPQLLEECSTRNLVMIRHTVDKQ